jgi:hypothetical protein
VEPDEHRFLLSSERSTVTGVVAWAASSGDRSENADYQYGKRRLRQIDRRIRFLTAEAIAGRIRHRQQQSSRSAFLCAQYFDRIFQRHSGDNVCADAFAEQAQISIRKRLAASDDVGLDVYEVVPCAPNFREGVKYCS